MWCIVGFDCLLVGLNVLVVLCWLGCEVVCGWFGFIVGLGFVFWLLW